MLIRELLVAPDLVDLAIPCAPFGAPAVLVLVTDADTGGLVAAEWHWRDGTERLAVIGES